VVFASFFVNVAAPTGGASGAALFVDDAARRGQSSARTTAGVLLMATSHLTAFIPVLLVGLFYLFRQHDLQIYEIIGSLILLLLIVILSMIFLFGLRRPTKLRKLLYSLQKGVNWFGSRIKLPHLLKDDWAENNSNEFIEAAIAIAAHPLRLRKTILIALCAHLVDLSSLYVLFLAFHQPGNLILDCIHYSARHWGCGRHNDACIYIIRRTRRTGCDRCSRFSRVNFLASFWDRLLFTSPG
jgi:hypothetical protein